jgi:UDPglucose 6-dehydrogenase
MKVTIVGTGYVGLVTATCLADSGNHVLGVDVDQEKVRLLSEGQCTIYEPGLAELLKANVAAGRFRMTSELSEAVTHGEVIFIAVGTPPLPDGAADLSGVEGIVREIAKQMASPRVVVIKSTVPVGTTRAMGELMEGLTAHPYAVVSNPEFLREGEALDDFLRPDRIIIGSEDEQAVELMKELYAPFAKSPHAIQVMTREAAEMVKYASNAYLAARISFVNEIADICAHTGVDINEVRAGMGADTRIGTMFLEPGIGYGGSCFPKDIQALIKVAQRANCSAGILESVDERNDQQKQLLAQKVLDRYGEDLTGKTFAIWGMAFKPKTDDMREAPALRIIEMLCAAGAHLKCYDPKASDNARKELSDEPNVSFADDPYEVVQDADGLIICTDWNEFRTPDFDLIRSGLNERVIFDGRNLYHPQTMRRRRIEYHSVGRPTAIPVSGGSSS